MVQTRVLRCERSGSLVSACTRRWRVRAGEGDRRTLPVYRGARERSDAGHVATGAAAATSTRYDCDPVSHALRSRYDDVRSAETSARNACEHLSFMAWCHSRTDPYLGFRIRRRGSGVHAASCVCVREHALPTAELDLYVWLRSRATGPD